jgi:hypothetical protein
MLLRHAALGLATLTATACLETRSSTLDALAMNEPPAPRAVNGLRSFLTGTVTLPFVPLDSTALARLTALEHPVTKRWEPGSAGGALAPATAAEERYRAVFGDAPRALVVDPPAVDLTLRIHNDGREPIHIKTSGDDVHLRMALRGPGARHALGGGDAREIYFCGQWTTIAPGAHYDLPIKKLEYGDRASRLAAYFTASGRYRLSASLVTQVARGAEPDACDQGEPSELIAQPIDLAVGEAGW